MPTLLESFQERIRETTRRLRERFQDNSIYDAANYTVEESPSPTYHLWYDHTLTNKTYEDTTPYPDLIMVLLGSYQSEEERKFYEQHEILAAAIRAQSGQRLFISTPSVNDAVVYGQSYLRTIWLD